MTRKVKGPIKTRKALPVITEEQLEQFERNLKVVKTWTDEELVGWCRAHMGFVDADRESLQMWAARKQTDPKRSAISGWS